MAAMTNPQKTDREQLLDRLLKIRRFRRTWGKDFIVRRVAKMTDQQVTTALTMTTKDFKAAATAKRRPQYAPPTGDKLPFPLGGDLGDGR